jgi:hypothetical protein
MFYLNSVAESHKSSKASLVDGPKLTQEPSVKVVDILKTNMYLLCRILGCWV